MAIDKDAARPQAAPPVEQPPALDPASQPTPPKGATKRGLLSTLGPGLVTGASDDDPSGIATYSQVGAQFGFGMLWTMLFSYPLMAGIQEISAQIGRVTGMGIAGNLRRHYPRWLLYGIVFLVVSANIINLGVDLMAMGDAASLLLRGPALMYAAALALLCVALEIAMPYDRYANFLKWLTMALFAYVATVFIVHVPWLSALKATVVPSFSFKTDYLTSIVAVLGTTISPYLFFWQAESEVEIEKTHPMERPLRAAPGEASSQLHRIRIDTYTGMAFSNLVAFFIILATAVTLHAHGVTDIETSTQAAQALRPVAGPFAFLLFTLGIIGTGMLAVPVLAGSSAYALGEALGWPVGLNRAPMQARGFYIAIGAATLVGLSISLLHLNPIKALFWSAVINGVAAGPIMILMMLMANSRQVMGRFPLNPRQNVLGWLATAAMLLAAVGLFATWGK